MRLDQDIRRIAGKELTLFFSSPIAYLFLATFAAITLFVFFWVDAFFARNIADVRPLFEWMPVLLIFLSGALTMRMWSEERRTGTLEFVLTLPVSTTRFVLGKFVACLSLLLLALILTAPLPLTVAWIGNLDWGPVAAAYLATVLMGAAYLSIGLFVSARSDSQIVSLILTTLVCGVFYLLGANLLTDFLDNRPGELLRSLGSGSRFDSITRGVLDLGDLYFYLSITTAFLTLNVFSLERLRWSSGTRSVHHRRWRALAGLLVANALLANAWLTELPNLRWDLTEGRLYSLSETTREQLAQLEEPLLIRGYFSAKTHPLLAPLAPQLQDLIREYAAVGGDRVRAEIVDPASEPNLEDEANKRYGIRPVPLQVADKYQSSLVNSYFDVLIEYGDQYQVLGFSDLIEIKVRGEADVDVQLRNPEYDITRAVKKVVSSFRSGGDLFGSLPEGVTLTFYASDDSRLPEQLVKFKSTVRSYLNELNPEAREKLAVQWLDPAQNGGAIARQIEEDYGFMPMATSLFDTEQFYFYMTLSNGKQIVQLPLPEDLSVEAFDRLMDNGLMRFASGFLKTIALVTPPADPAMMQYGMGGGARQFNQLRTVLSENFNLSETDLTSGRVPLEADVLLLVAPESLDNTQLFAIDQFLMQGGTVIAATAPVAVELGNQRLVATEYDSGLTDWLAHHGLAMPQAWVMDPRNAAFPLPVTRNVGDFSFQEMAMLDYPYFVDVRGEGLNADHPIVSSLPQITMAWASPIEIDPQAPAQRNWVELMHSSAEAWRSTDLDVMPRLDTQGRADYQPQGERGPQTLGVLTQGRFESYFAARPSPLLADESSAQNDASIATETVPDNPATISGVIEKSAESARLIVFSSNEFLADQVINLSGATSGTEYLNATQMIANAVEWSVEDTGLLSIRGRGHFNRTLPPMERDQQRFLEYLNYTFALAGIAIVALVHRRRKSRRMAAYRQLLANAEV